MTVAVDDKSLSLDKQAMSGQSITGGYQGYSFLNTDIDTPNIPLTKVLSSYLGRLSVDDQNNALDDLYPVLTFSSQDLQESGYSPYSKYQSKKYRHFIKQSFKWSSRITIGLFAVIGLIFTSVYFGMQLGLFNVQGSITQRDSFYGSLSKIPHVAAAVSAPQNPAMTNVCDKTPADCAWINSPQWATVSAGLVKDSSAINQAASKTGVSPRMIIAAVGPEQIRLFTSEREDFEQYFQPLKVLGSMTSFSLGVAGIKQQTANQIEANLSNINSPFYPGPGYSKLITYPDDIHSSSLQYDRLTSNNHYYDYLYTGLFIKELESQWLKAGYNIDQRPDVITTLYNIGFQFSVPKANPEAGGSTITVANQSYSFGQLGTLLYNSNQLSSLFPITSQ